MKLYAKVLNYIFIFAEAVYAFFCLICFIARLIGQNTPLEQMFYRAICIPAILIAISIILLNSETHLLNRGLIIHIFLLSIIPTAYKALTAYLNESDAARLAGITAFVIITGSLKHLFKYKKSMPVNLIKRMLINFLFFIPFTVYFLFNMALISLMSPRSNLSELLKGIVMTVALVPCVMIGEAVRLADKLNLFYGKLSKILTAMISGLLLTYYICITLRITTEHIIIGVFSNLLIITAALYTAVSVWDLYKYIFNKG